MAFSVKRLCICGTPKFVRTNITRKNWSVVKNNLGTVNRVDLYNMSGPLMIKDAFNESFSGDVYMKDLDDLISLRSHGFNGQKSLSIIGVQG